MHAEHILSAADGGIVATNNDQIAQRLNAMRPSYNGAATAPIVRVANARLSEAQAAIALLNLEDFAHNRLHNLALWHAWQSGLQAIPGIGLQQPQFTTASNTEKVVLRVDEVRYGLSRDILLQCLKAENVYARPCFNESLSSCFPKAVQHNYPVSHVLYRGLIEMPHGKTMTEQSVGQICELLGSFHHYRDRILPKHA